MDSFSCEEFAARLGVPLEHIHDVMHGGDCGLGVPGASAASAGTVAATRVAGAPAAPSRLNQRMRRASLRRSFRAAQRVSERAAAPSHADDSLVQLALAQAADASAAVKDEGAEMALPGKVHPLFAKKSPPAMPPASLAAPSRVLTKDEQLSRGGVAAALRTALHLEPAPSVGHMRTSSSTRVETWYP